jgi:hypothetical protein
LDLEKRRKKPEKTKLVLHPSPPPQGKDIKAKESGSQEATDIIAPPPEKKKKMVTIKTIFIILMVLGSIGIASFWVYSIYFAEKDPENKVYQKIELSHVKLPEEMLQFTFNHLYNFCVSLVSFNSEIIIFDNELARIAAIAEKYPEQQKITVTEKKALEKGRNTLLKVFSKLEKPIKETYVLFQVDNTQGLAQIKEREKDLADTAQTALKTAQEQTQRIKAQAPRVPEGILQGTVYKLKKKFL